MINWDQFLSFVVGFVLGVVVMLVWSGHAHAASACDIPWQSYSATQVISGDPFVADHIGTLSRLAYVRMVNGMGGQAQLNGYFRGLYGGSC